MKYPREPIRSIAVMKGLRTLASVVEDNPRNLRRLFGKLTAAERRNLKQAVEWIRKIDVYDDRLALALACDDDT
jgi:hypothetical protein